VDSNIVAATIALGGALLGFAASSVTQVMIGRRAERAATRSELFTSVERRNGMLIDTIDKFLSWAQKAERQATAVNRFDRNDEEWRGPTREIMDEVWRYQKLIRVICPSLEGAARTLAQALSDQVWHGEGHKKVQSALREPRDRFLNEATEEMAARSLR
jgi:hypothetical protein